MDAADPIACSVRVWAGKYAPILAQFYKKLKQKRAQTVIVKARAKLITIESGKPGYRGVEFSTILKSTLLYVGLSNARANV